MASTSLRQCRTTHKQCNNFHMSCQSATTSPRCANVILFLLLTVALISLEYFHRRDKLSIFRAYLLYSWLSSLTENPVVEVPNFRPGCPPHCAAWIFKYFKQHSTIQLGIKFDKNSRFMIWPHVEMLIENQFDCWTIRKQMCVSDCITRQGSKSWLMVSVWPEREKTSFIAVLVWTMIWRYGGVSSCDPISWSGLIISTVNLSSVWQIVPVSPSHTDQTRDWQCKPERYRYYRKQFVKQKTNFNKPRVGVLQVDVAVTRRENNI